MKKAFTLIELIIVLVILLILVSLIITGVRSSINKAYRLSCAKNMHSIVQALQFAVEDKVFGSNPIYSDAKDLYGDFLYYPTSKEKIGGITDLKTYVCPATKHLPPTTTGGYNKKLACDATNTDLGSYNPNYTGTSIDYWVIKRQKTFGGSEFGNPYFENMPKGNAVLWEASNVGSGVHHKEGRNTGFWNGSVKFIASFDSAQYPVNLFDNYEVPSDPNNGKPECDSSGNPYTIASVERYVYPW